LSLASSQPNPHGRRASTSPAIRRPFVAWSAADRLGPLEANRVWPGLLGFVAPATLGTGLGRGWTWLTARRWRWLGLLVLPALAVAAVLWFSRGVSVPVVAPTFGSSSSVLAPLKPLHLVGWHWFVVQPWWWLVLLFVPGAVPLIFCVARAALEIVLRFAGTVILVVLLALVHNPVCFNLWMM
jgi:hypothetical protein